MLKETILTVYQGHTNAVWAVAWSPDGKYIASGSDDCTVQVWDPMTGHRRCMYTEHDSDVRAITWSPDSMRIDDDVFCEKVNAYAEAVLKRTYQY